MFHITFNFSNLSSNGIGETEIDNNDEGNYLPDKQEDTIKNMKNTNPFLTDDGSYITVDDNVDYSPINPFISYIEKNDKTSTYTSFVEPDFDSCALIPECDIQKRTFEHLDAKPPVLCFVYPNNHQTNGLRTEGSLSDDVFCSPDVRNTDDLITFDEVRHEHDASSAASLTQNYHLIGKTVNEPSSIVIIEFLIEIEMHIPY